MALDFPTNPSNGQTYLTYTYDTSIASWRSNPLVKGPAYISDTPPALAANGDVWFNAADGTLFVRYDNNWVEARSDETVTPGSIVQVASSTTTQVLSGTLGSSANPTSTDGTLFHSFSFTPKFANSKLLIQSSNVYMGETSNIGDEFYLAAYYDTTRIAISAGGNSPNSFAGSLNIAIHSLNHLFDSWGTTAKTISVRVGSASNNGGSMYVNQNVSYNMFNSAARVVSFTIMEVAQ